MRSIRNDTLEPLIRKVVSNQEVVALLVFKLLFENVVKLRSGLLHIGDLAVLLVAGFAGRLLG